MYKLEEECITMAKEDPLFAGAGPFPNILAVVLFTIHAVPHAKFVPWGVQPVESHMKRRRWSVEGAPGSWVKSTEPCLRYWREKCPDEDPWWNDDDAGTLNSITEYPGLILSHFQRSRQNCWKKHDAFAKRFNKLSPSPHLRRWSTTSKMFRSVLSSRSRLHPSSGGMTVILVSASPKISTRTITLQLRGLNSQL